MTINVTSEFDAAARVIDERHELRADCPLFAPGTFGDRPTVITPDPAVVLDGDLTRVDLPVALMERAATAASSPPTRCSATGGCAATHSGPRPACPATSRRLLQLGPGLTRDRIKGWVWPAGMIFRVTAAFAASAGSSQPGRPPFMDATPAQIRDVLAPEDAAEFDRQWRDVMEAATDRLDLSEVHEVLESWRRIAWLTAVRGPLGYRRTMAAAEQRLHTGERGAGSLPWHQLKTELGLSE